MKNHLGYIASFYLGFSLSYFAGLNFTNWKMWVIGVPVLTLFALDKNLNNGK